VEQMTGNLIKKIYISKIIKKVINDSNVVIVH